MTKTDTDSLWYAVYQNLNNEARHVGSYHVELSRDSDGHRVQDHEITTFNGETPHKSHCRLVIERRGGRFAPLRVDYNEAGRESSMAFEAGRIQASGAAKDHDGVAVPEDVMTTYGVWQLAESIYNQPEASLSFDAITDATGAMCGTDAKLVARGLAKETPFPSEAKLWEVEWLSNEGTRIQAFYFTDEGTLAQADWGNTSARLVHDEQEATPAHIQTAGDS